MCEDNLNYDEFRCSGAGTIHLVGKKRGVAGTEIGMLKALKGVGNVKGCLVFIFGHLKVPLVGSSWAWPSALPVVVLLTTV